MSARDIITVEDFLKKPPILTKDIRAFLDKTISGWEFGSNDDLIQYENGVLSRPIYGTKIGDDQGKDPTLDLLPVGEEVSFQIGPYSEIICPLNRELILHTDSSDVIDVLPFSKKRFEDGDLVYLQASPSSNIPVLFMRLYIDG